MPVETFMEVQVILDFATSPATVMERHDTSDKVKLLIKASFIYHTFIAVSWVRSMNKRYRLLSRYYL